MFHYCYHCSALELCQAHGECLESEDRALKRAKAAFCLTRWPALPGLSQPSATDQEAQNNGNVLPHHLEAGNRDPGVGSFSEAPREPRSSSFPSFWWSPGTRGFPGLMEHRGHHGAPSPGPYIVLALSGPCPKFPLRQALE